MQTPLAPACVCVCVCVCVCQTLNPKARRAYPPSLALFHHILIDQSRLIKKTSPRKVENIPPCVEIFRQILTLRRNSDTMITVTSNVVPVRARVQPRANRSVIARCVVSSFSRSNPRLVRVLVGSSIEGPLWMTRADVDKSRAIHGGVTVWWSESRRQGMENMT